MNQSIFTQRRSQTRSRKRIAVAVTLLPLTLTFALAHRLIEWWHFSVSQGLLQLCRTTAKRRDAFFSSLDKPSASGGDSQQKDQK